MEDLPQNRLYCARCSSLRLISEFPTATGGTHFRTCAFCRFSSRALRDRIVQNQAQQATYNNKQATHEEQNQATYVIRQTKLPRARRLLQSQSKRRNQRNMASKHARCAVCRLKGRTEATCIVPHCENCLSTDYTSSKCPERSTTALRPSLINRRSYTRLNLVGLGISAIILKIALLP